MTLSGRRDVIRDALKATGVWPGGKEKTKPYLTLEQQIRELWESRGMEVISETVRNIGSGRFEWTIIGKTMET